MIKKEQRFVIYLVRHGHPQLPDDGSYYLGQTNIPLSERGVQQAQWLRQFFAQSIEQGQISMVYHSPLQRCQQTAQIIADGKVCCQPVESLQEIDMGQWEMVPMAHIKQAYPALYQQRGAQIDVFRPPDGESFVQCQQRSVAALQRIVSEQSAEGSCIVVAHAGVNRCLLSWLRQQPLCRLLTIAQPYACITKISISTDLTGQHWQVHELLQCPL